MQQTSTPESSPIKKEPIDSGSAPEPVRPRKRKQTAIKREDDTDVPETHLPTPPSDRHDTKETPARKRARKSDSSIKAEPTTEEAGLAVKSGILSPTAAKKAKNYGLKPGETPYPNWVHPTPDECHEINRILSKVHGKVSKPKAIAAPSLTSAGCGEVPSVLDALIRTRLSAATTNRNSSNAFQGLVKTFGTLKHGVGKNSVDWNKVRLADQKEVFEAIKCGGLANNKSRDIKAILESVYEENQARSADLKEAEDSKSNVGPAGAENEEQAEKEAEVERADNEVLSLDHLHLLSDEEATKKLVAYPGIGPKTASCVLLFCLRRDSFPVDTHVFRLAKWLGWVPPDDALEKGEPRVSRETCHAHCEVRVPADLKYALHQLLIKHGKTCPRCRAATGLGSERWNEGCPIEKLVKRHGAKKGGFDGESPNKKRAAKKGRKAVSEDEDEADMTDELSDVGSDELSDVGSDHE